MIENIIAAIAVSGTLASPVNSLKEMQRSPIPNTIKIKPIEESKQKLNNFLLEKQELQQSIRDSSEGNIDELKSKLLTIEEEIIKINSVIETSQQIVPDKLEKFVKKNNQYFTKLHDAAILEFVSSTDKKRKNDLYITLIQPALKEMINKIALRYRFTNLSNIELLCYECESHLIGILNKFDPNKGYKAYSYLSIITKNFFIHKAKKEAIQVARDIQHENVMNYVNHEKMIVENNYDRNRMSLEFVGSMMKEFEFWEAMDLKPNELKVLAAIKILLKNVDSVDIINKKAINVYLRELTGLNTKQILVSINRFRDLYGQFKDTWENDI